MNDRPLLRSAAVVALLATACASPIRPTPLGPDSYTLNGRGLTDKDNMGNRSVGEQKVVLFEQAIKYCGQQGRRAELLAERAVDTRWSKMALAEIDFRCVGQ